MFFVEGTSLWQHSVAADPPPSCTTSAGSSPQPQALRSRYEGEPSADGRYFRVLCLTTPRGDAVVIATTARPTRSLGRLDEPTGRDQLGRDGHERRAHRPRDRRRPVLCLPSRLHAPDCSPSAQRSGMPTWRRRPLAPMSSSTRTRGPTGSRWPDLETGAETNLIALPFSDNTDLGMHVQAER